MSEIEDFVDVDPEEEKHQINTSLPESVIEYLRAASFHENQPITEIVERAVVEELNRMTAEHGERYEVYPTHKVRK